MEGLVNPDPAFWEGRRVFLTGHTGFKGAWLSLWLQYMGAIVRGYALDPPTEPNLFTQADIASGMDSIISDIRDYEKLRNTLVEYKPDVVFHLAAQPLVRESYRTPRETYETNVMGTVNLLEAVRGCSSVRSVVVITTDKVYENKEWHWGYREVDQLGGYDPYSNSKAAAELVVSAYRNSFFNIADYGKSHHVALASARAGNVIGVGDWAKDRLIPDIVRSFVHRTTLHIRNPISTRPWQHVLEPLSGYLLLAQSLYDSMNKVGGWNFGPRDTDARTVRWVVETCRKTLPKLTIEYGAADGPHEAGLLKLDISKSESELLWSPKWDAAKAISITMKSYRELVSNPAEALAICHRSIREYSG